MKLTLDGNTVEEVVKYRKQLINKDKIAGITYVLEMLKFDSMTNKIHITEAEQKEW